MSRLYFLHIPKTAGSSLTRLLEDAWPAGGLSPHRFVEDLVGVSREELDSYDIIAGHFGIHPLAMRERTITVLRDPVARAWSHYRALQTGSMYAPTNGSPDFESFGALLDDPVFGWLARDYQAHWLSVAPYGDKDWPLGLPPGSPHPNGSDAGPRPTRNDLARRAPATLAHCALAGTVERLDEFVEALARMLGRPLSPPPRINVGQAGKPVTRAEARKVRARSRMDTMLHAAADRALDDALESLPSLPRAPRAELPYEYDMSGAFCGRGWHARTRTPEAGWHRWTAATRADVELPVRLAGRARLHLAILSAYDDEVVRSLRLRVQDRPVDHRLVDADVGVAAVAEIELDPDRPLTVGLETAHTGHVVDSATGERSPDQAGLAVGRIAFRPAG